MRQPKHATIVAYLALFVALSGSAYAATGNSLILGHANTADQPTSLANTQSGPALRLSTNQSTASPFTVSNGTKIAKLNADRLDGLDASAFQSKAVRISATTTSATTGAHRVAAAGLWTVSLTCKDFGPGNGGLATLTIHGPGTAQGVHTIAQDISAGNTFVAGPKDIGTGYATTADTGEQVAAMMFLQSGSTVMQVQYVLTATPNTSPETCAVLGDAVRVS
jgi:hypothetical protein